MTKNQKSREEQQPEKEQTQPVVETLWAETSVFPYQANSKIVSKAEYEFYLAARKALGSDYVLCPKPSLAAFFSISDPAADFLAADRLSRVNVDFLVCSVTTLRIFFGIQFEENQKKPESRKQDAFIEEAFKAAGLPLLHIHQSDDYSLPDLKEWFDEAILDGKQTNDAPHTDIEQHINEPDIDFLPAIGVREVQAAPAPPPPPPQKPDFCPNCGAAMTLRKSIKGPNVGKEFYVCTRYPECKTYLKAQ